MTSIRSARSATTPAHHVDLDPEIGNRVLAQTGAVECRIDQCQSLFALLGAMQHDVGPGERELQPRVRLHRSRGQLADQTDQGGHLGLLEQVAAVALDELHRPLLVARGERVIDRLTDQSVLGEPPRRDAVQLHDPLGSVTLEPVPQELA